jgi:NAD(P)H-hydrate epimerase
MSPPTLEKETILPVQLYCAEQVRAMDRYAIERLNIPSLTLMESAGKAAWELLLERWPNAKVIAVFCGPGNNGGDGYVVARLAKEAGLEVHLYSTTKSDCLKGDAAIVCQRWMEVGGVNEKQSRFGETSLDLIVDALLGTGLDRLVEGEIATAIDEINSVNVPVLALDIASGLHSDKGALLGVAVEAEATISFIGLKQGLFTGAGAALSGEIYFDSLGVPEVVLTSQLKSSERFAPSSPCLPKRKKSAHKGLFGHVLVVGGACGFSGAAQMAASAALRSGAGLVSVATRKEHAPLLNLMHSELMVHGVNQKIDLRLLLERATVAAVGLGLGQAVWGQELLAELIATNLPLVVDADALNLLAKEPLKRGNWILTPHPGEAARLLGMTAKEVEDDRFSAVRKLQEKLGGIVILKGAGTVVFDGSELTINTTGNPGMASGGMGDVLSGVIAALLAQGLSLSKAARLGVWLHGKAADLSAVDGERGLLASDLLGPLRELVNR